MQGVRRAVREHLDHGRTTFSGFGNPYQLRFGSFQVESPGPAYIQDYRKDVTRKGPELEY
jgi:hypothetical protein